MAAHSPRIRGLEDNSPIIDSEEKATNAINVSGFFAGEPTRT